ncbi:MAG: hypothetical protein EXR51_06570 [Dehalococcoidia bacterium]|nr:hypothetical protein [Dehalococcoidia bacterium]
MASPLSPSDQRYADALEFLYHEADLLDTGRFLEWLDLLTPDIRYVMPAGDPGRAGGPAHPHRIRTAEGVRGTTGPRADRPYAVAAGLGRGVRIGAPLPPRLHGASAKEIGSGPPAAPVTQDRTGGGLPARG